MARKFAQIKVAIWKNDDFRALSLPEQWLYEALLSQPDLSLAGAIMCRPRRWAALTTGVTVDDVEQWLRSLETKRYLLIDWDTDEVVIRTFIKHDGSGGNKLFILGVRSAIDRIESDRLRTHAEQALDAKLNTPESHGESDGERDDASHGQSHGASDDDKPKALSRNRKPTTVNPESSSSKQQPELPSAAAAAMDILVEHRFATTRVDNRTMYERTIRTEEAELNMERLLRYAARGDDPVDIAVNVFGLTGRQARSAQAARMAQEGRSGNGALLDCEHCSGDGVWSPLSDGVVIDCMCKPAYGPLATVHQLHEEKTA